MECIQILTLFKSTHIFELLFGLLVAELTWQLIKTVKDTLEALESLSCWWLLSDLATRSTSIHDGIHLHGLRLLPQMLLLTHHLLINWLLEDGAPAGSCGDQILQLFDLAVDLVELLLENLLEVCDLIPRK